MVTRRRTRPPSTTNALLTGWTVLGATVALIIMLAVDIGRV